jgi:UrcA family protein
MSAHKVAKTTIAAVALIAFGLPLSASAAAPTQFDRVSVKVTFEDLNIRTDAGAKSLYARLQRASRKACDFRSAGLKSIRETTQSRRCYNETLEAAVQKIDNDKLSQIHSS